MKIFIVTILAFFHFTSQNVASAVDFRTVESETYRLFMEQKWDSVIIIGKNALRENIDYFYLRLRLGISYFEIKKYLRAIDHLQKAREFNSTDPLATEYLYESYIRSGRIPEARALAATMPAALTEKLRPEYNTFENVHLEGGYTFSSNDKGSQEPFIMGSDSIYGEEDRYGDHSYLNLDLTLNLASKVSLTLAYNYLNFSKKKYFQYGYYQDHLDSTTNFWWGYENHYSWDKKVTSYHKNYSIVQHEGYIGSTFQLPESFKLIPAFHLLYTISDEPEAVYNPKTVTDTIFADTITPYTSFYTFQQADYSFIQHQKNYLNYLISLMLKKDFSVFTSGLAGSYSNLNNMTQTQVSWSLTYYPWGRTTFYGASSFMALFQEGRSSLIFHQTIGGKVLPGLWLEGSAIIGDLTNANLMNGYIVYNNTDKINYRLGANLVFSLIKNLDISVIWQYFSNKNIRYYYTAIPGESSQSVKLVTDYNNYQTNTIIGGVTWKF